MTCAASSGVIYNLNGGVISIDVAGGATLNFVSQGLGSGTTGGYVKSGNGVLALSGGTYTGGFTLSAGAVVVRSVNALGTGGSLAINGGILTSNGVRDMSGKFSGGITIGGDFQMGALSSAISLSSDSGSIAFNNNMSLGGSTRTITIGNNGTHTFAGVISGNNATTGLTIDALSGVTGAIVLSGANTYTGTTTVKGGTLICGANDVFADASDIAVTGGTLSMNTRTDTVKSVTLASGTISGTTGVLTTTSDYNMQSGVVSAVLSGSVNLAKTTIGTVTLSGVNTYTGTTTLSGGRLVLSGSGRAGSGNMKLNGGTLDLSSYTANSGTYTLAASQTLSGNGTITGAAGKTLAVAGTFGSATGNAGIITLDTVTLQLSGASIVKFTNGSLTLGTYDLVTGTAGGGTESVVFGGTLLLDFSGGSYASFSNLKIFDVDSYSGTFTNISYIGLAAGQSAVFNALDGTVTVVPEPESLALMIFGLAFMFILLRRRQDGNA